MIKGHMGHHQGSSLMIFWATPIDCVFGVFLWSPVGTIGYHGPKQW